ncbi:MAG: hypothetical protein V4515_12590 [Chloroflexota bacterium]
MSEYDDAAVELVASQFEEFLHQEGAAGRPNDFATEVLDALADAGLLLAPGGRNTEERSCIHRNRETGRIRSCTTADCHGTPNVRRTVTRWADDAVYFGPWTEIE